ncbi:MAG: AEC family transporter [Planctomycetota bacterium]
MGEKLPTLLTLLPAVVTVYGTMAGGFLLRRYGFFSSSVDVPMMRLVINVLFPAFIISKLLGNMPDAAAVAPAIGFGSLVVGFAVAYLASPWLGLTQPRSRRAFALVVGVFNFGFLPIPLATALGSAGLVHPDTVPAIFVHNIGVEIAFWSIGVMLASGHFQRDSWKKLLNAPLITVALVLIMNLTGAADGLAETAPRINDWILSTGTFIGGAAIPVVLFLIGGSVAEAWDEADFRRGLPTIVGASAIRLGVLPVMMVGAAYLLTDVTEGQRDAVRDAIVIQASMPCALFPIVLCRLYGADTATAVRAVLGTVLLSIVTTPLWLVFML